jgi:signal peptidase II
MTLSANQRMGLVAALIFGADQLTKLAVLRHLGLHESQVVVDGFFKLVHWGNTGAAWSMFKDNNELLSIVSLLALALLFFARDQFDAHTRRGQIALGLIFGGILGNVVDRLQYGHVVDFLYFYTYRRSGDELGFPAFNVADSAICTGIGLLFLLAALAQLRSPAAEARPAPDAAPPQPPES